MPRMSFGEGLAAGFLDTFGNDLRQGFAEEEKADSLRKALERRQQMINQQMAPDLNLQTAPPGPATGGAPMALNQAPTSALRGPQLLPLPPDDKPQGFLQNLGRALKAGRAPGSLTEPLRMEESMQDMQLKEYLRQKDEESKFGEMVKKLTFQEALRRGRPLRPEEEQKLEAQTRAATERGLTSQVTRQLREQQLKEGPAMGSEKLESEKALTGLRKAQTERAQRDPAGGKEKDPTGSLARISAMTNKLQDRWKSLSPDERTSEIGLLNQTIRTHNRQHPQDAVSEFEAGPDTPGKLWGSTPGTLIQKPAAPKAPAFDVTADDIEQSYKNGTITKQERDRAKKELGY